MALFTNLQTQGQLLNASDDRMDGCRLHKTKRVVSSRPLRGDVSLQKFGESLSLFEAVASVEWPRKQALSRDAITGRSAENSGERFAWSVGQ